MNLFLVVISFYNISVRPYFKFKLKAYKEYNLSLINFPNKFNIILCTPKCRYIGYYSSEAHLCKSSIVIKT